MKAKFWRVWYCPKCGEEMFADSDCSLCYTEMPEDAEITILKVQKGQFGAMVVVDKHKEK